MNNWVAVGGGDNFSVYKLGGRNFVVNFSYNSCVIWGTEDFFFDFFQKADHNHFVDDVLVVISSSKKRFSYKKRSPKWLGQGSWQFYPHHNFSMIFALLFRAIFRVNFSFGGRKAMKNSAVIIRVNFLILGEGW